MATRVSKKSVCAKSVQQAKKKSKEARLTFDALRALMDDGMTLNEAAQHFVNTGALSLTLGGVLTS